MNAFPQRLTQTLNIAAGSTASTNALVLTEAAVIVHYSVSSANSFTCWLEGSNDGVDWFTLESNASSDASSDAATRYFASTAATHPFVAFRQVRVRVRNNGSSAASFVVAIVAKE
jgi:hypothetical protein